FFSSRRRHTRSKRDWSSDVCSSDLSNNGSASEVSAETPVGFRENGARAVVSTLHRCLDAPPGRAQWSRRSAVVSTRQRSRGGRGRILLGRKSIRTRPGVGRLYDEAMDPPAQSRSHALIHPPKSLALMLQAALAALALVLLAGCGASDPEQDSASDSGSDSAAADSTAEAAAGTCSYPTGSQPAAKDVEVPPQTPQATGEVEAAIATSVGDLAVTLDAEGAPCTVNSFLSLAVQEYFDDTDCHRLTT